MKRLLHNPYRQLEQKLGHRFRNKNLLATALMHRSYRFENNSDRADNQRLEFLGDSVLGLVVTEHLFKVFPESDEGSLTCLRSRLTNGKALSQAASAIKLGEHLKLGKGELLTGGQSRESNLEDAMEAVLGAAYLDGGFKAVTKIFKKLILPIIDMQPENKWQDNPKGELQKICQSRWGENPVYKLAGQEGPAHARVFTIKVTIQGRLIATAKATNKKNAEQDAAIQALERLRREGSL